MFMGHLAIALAFVLSLQFPLIPVIIGSYLPDLIDKPLSVFGLTDGRSPLVHSFLILLPFLAWLALDRKSKVPLALSLGIISHLLIDLLNDPGVFLFYPFGGYIDIGFFKEALIFPKNILSGSGPWFFIEDKLLLAELLSLFACIPISYLIVKRRKKKSD